jgi:cell division protein ZapA
MAQLSVSIGGRPYRLACNPGEEPHLESLARVVDEKINQMRGSFGEIGDQRLVVMAALTLADDISEARRASDARAARAEAALAEATAAREAAERRLESLTRGVDEMSARAEALVEAFAASRD